VGPFDISGRVVLTSDLNRYFLSDKSNANFALTVRQGFWRLKRRAPLGGWQPAAGFSA